jgi:hypothetical protein
LEEFHIQLGNFKGFTFVAFLDISGFKQLMKEDRARKALDAFYNAGYYTLNNNNQNIKGIFVSDCGILFCEKDLENSNISDKKSALKSLLMSIKNINREMSYNDFILTTSITYGEFEAQDRINTPCIEKNAIYGNAYVNSFLDNENGVPRIQPGQCRIVINEKFPMELFGPNDSNRNDNVFGFIKREEPDINHYYYYWMVNEEDEIEKFKKNYKDSYNLKYMGMLQALKHYS